MENSVEQHDLNENHLESNEQNHNELNEHSHRDSITLLYDAAFDRDADDDGQAHWESALSGDSTINDIAKQFIESNEFISRYGENLNDNDFVDVLYRNVLDREADEGGKTHWISELESGKERAELLSAFSESPEHSNLILSTTSINQATLPQVSTATQNLVLTTSQDFQKHSDADSIKLLYDAAFDRDPDEEGLAHWESGLAGDLPLNDIANQFLQSNEFSARYGDNLNNDDFVEILYQNVLDRASDSGGKLHWVSELESGKERSEVLSAFSESDEHATIVLSGVSETFDFI